MAQLGLNDLKPGVIFKLNGEPHVVLTSHFMRTAQRKPVRQSKVKSLVSGKVLDMNFNFNAKYEEADVTRSSASVLFKDKTGFTFMDIESYEQFSISLEDLGDQAKYLKEGIEVIIVRFEGTPISVELPKKINLKIIETADAVARGDTAQGTVLKEAKLETGYSVKVPLFIKNGETIRINTDTGEYVERA